MLTKAPNNHPSQRYRFDDTARVTLNPTTRIPPSTDHHRQASRSDVAHLKLQFLARKREVLSIGCHKRWSLDSPHPRSERFHLEPLRPSRDPRLHRTAQNIVAVQNKKPLTLKRRRSKVYLQHSTHIQLHRRRRPRRPGRGPAAHCQQESEERQRSAHEPSQNSHPRHIPRKSTSARPRHQRIDTAMCSAIRCLCGSPVKGELQRLVFEKVECDRQLKMSFRKVVLLCSERSVLQ